MFTLQEVHFWLDRLYKETKKTKGNIIKYYSEFEKSLNITRCPIENKYSHFNADLFKEIQSEEFYNPYINWIGECFIDSLSQGRDKFLINQKIKNHIINLKKIGISGSYGFTFLSDYQTNKKKTKELFVIKSSIYEDDKFDESRHEVLIGLELNKLRNKVPNFAYVYGGFNCGLPMIINDKAQNWCSANNNVGYIVYEYIKSTIRFQDYISNCSTEQFIEKYLQILLSLNLAYKETDFTHYDLHTDNVLLRDIENNKIAIKYNFPNNRIRYLLTDKIMTIIDYGFAHIKRNNNNLGNPLFTYHGIDPSSSHIYGDAFKLLGFSMLIMRHHNYPVYRSLYPLLRFFNNKDSVDDVIVRGRKEFYIFKKKDDSNLDNLITFILNNYKCSSFIVNTPPMGYKYVNCDDNKCDSLQSITRLFSDYDYEDLFEKIYTQGMNNVKYSNYLSARKFKIKQINNEEEKINKLISSLIHYRLDVNNLFDLNYMREYKRYLSKLAKLIDLTDKLKYNLILVDNADKEFNKEEEEELNKEEDKINYNSYDNLFKKVSECYRNMLIDSDKIEKERTKETTKIILNKRPVFNWWFDNERNAFSQ